MKVTLTEKDFKDFRSFENAIKKQTGATTYVGTNSMVVHFDYPPDLVAALRPNGPKTVEWEF